MNNDKWEYMFFRDALPITMGKTPPRGDSDSWDVNKKTKNKWVSIADISSNEGKYIFDTKEYISDIAASKIHQVKKGSLLMSFKLSIGKMAFAGTDLYTNEAIIAIPHNDRYLLRFLYYYFLSYHWNTLTDGNEKVKGATLNKKTIGEIKLPITSLSDQQEIVDYLDKAFAKIDALKKNAEQQLSDAKALFSAALEEAMTPKKGWEEKTLKELCSKIGSGATPKGGKKIYVNDGISLVRSMNVRYGKFDYNELAHIDNLSAERLKGVSLEENDVLFNITGASIARCCIVPKDVLPARVNQHVCILRIIGPIVSDFLSYCLNSRQHQKELLTIGEAASTRQALTKDDMEKHTISYPSLPEQQAIVAHLDTLSSKVNQLQDNYNKILRECDALKQALLREIFE